MFQHKVVIVILSTVVFANGHQRTPPGVNPNTYQQQLHSDGQPPPVQPQFHSDTQPKHVPRQQQQQQQQHHKPESHGPNPAVLHKDMSDEKEHLKEHMDLPMDTSSMSEQELQFHYFKMHDSDGNNKLDGCELVKSLIHWHDGDSHDGHDHELPPHYEDSQLAAFIDPVLKADDINNDGMIDYAEFIAAQIKTRSGLRQPVEISI